VLVKVQYGDFQDVSQSCDSSTNKLVLVDHNGEYRMSKRVEGHVDLSPSDPLFSLHHGIVDRSCFAWQNLDADGHPRPGRGERRIRHAFKFLPVLGQHVVDVIRREDPE